MAFEDQAVAYNFDIHVKLEDGYELSIDTQACYGRFSKCGGNPSGELKFQPIEVDSYEHGVEQKLELVEFIDCRCLPEVIYVELINMPKLVIDPEFDPHADWGRTGDCTRTCEVLCISSAHQSLLVNHQ